MQRSSLLNPDGEKKLQDLLLAKSRAESRLKGLDQAFTEGPMEALKDQIEQLKRDAKENVDMAQQNVLDYLAVEERRRKILVTVALTVLNTLRLHPFNEHESSQARAYLTDHFDQAEAFMTTVEQGSNSLLANIDSLLTTQTAHNGNDSAEYRQQAVNKSIETRIGMMFPRIKTVLDKKTEEAANKPQP